MASRRWGSEPARRCEKKSKSGQTSQRKARGNQMVIALDRYQGKAAPSAGLVQIAAACLLMVFMATQVAQAQEGVPAKRPKIGVAFEGGGALGLGHVGVLEWMEKNQIPVDYVAGTSMGGLVGGLYATGNSPAEIRALMRDIDWDAVLRGQIPFQDLSYRRKEDKRAYPNNIELGLHNKKLSLPGGLNSGQQVRFILDRAALPYSYLKSFDDLPIPFRCVATELGRARRTFSKTDPFRRPFALLCRFRQSSHRS